MKGPSFHIPKDNGLDTVTERENSLMKSRQAAGRELDEHRTIDCLSCSPCLCP